MTDTRKNVRLNPNEWLNIYLETGIASGTQIILQNIGTCDIYLTTSLTEPTDEESTQIVSRGEWVINDANDIGAWAYCQSDGGLFNVRLA